MFKNMFTGFVVLGVLALVHPEVAGAQLCSNCSPSSGLCELTIGQPGFGSCSNEPGGCLLSRPGECLELTASVAPDGIPMRGVVSVLRVPGPGPRAVRGGILQVAWAAFMPRNAESTGMAPDVSYTRDCRDNIVDRVYSPERAQALRQATDVIVL